jgi:hypothetical protein
MKSMNTALACVLLLGLGVAACEEEKAAPAPTPVAIKEAPKVAPAAVKKEQPAEVALESIPTEEAFEDEAISTITTASLEKQVDSLDKEIDSE